ncbi:MAG: polymerase III subunit beta, DNA polymerase III subunit beta protein [Candidatus Peregrinibacteria bacterium GW2011_GWF2_38_29]|nr:MAG: polymerase III subunit beta, DNA polymerase III subunit beta protein [Candidatus Peregrinibacteria bacterium GW2011_GWF2_38_29]HBB03225.1 DNA polymerase III subunit beta [Candidatus Peregrinibacteria bacterium]
MKVFCNQKELLNALNIVSKAVSQNVVLPVLNNILIKTEGKEMFFAATNLEIAIKYHLQTDVRNEGSMTVPAKLFTNYISLLPDEKVELSVLDNLTLAIKSSSSQTKIKGIHSDEFPLIPKTEKDHTLSIPAKELEKALNQVVFSASLNTSRPVLSGVYFLFDKDALKLVATDSYRLSERKISTKKDKDAARVECIVPARTAFELSKLLSKAAGDVDITISKNQILFAIGAIELTSRLIEGKFPDYERIIPKTSKTKILTSTADLELAMKRVSLFAKEDSNSVKISVTNDGKMMISTEETKVGEEKAEISVTIEGENNKIAFNAQYLLDVLPVLGEDKVCLEINDKLSPVVVRPQKNADYTYIIMPLKI